jgi:hypothetical protein
MSPCCESRKEMSRTLHWAAGRLVLCVIAWSDHPSALGRRVAVQSRWADSLDLSVDLELGLQCT